MNFKVENPGEFIKAKRKSLKLTLKVVSEYTGLSSGYLSRIENDSSTPSLEAVHKLARCLHFDVNDFCEFEALDLESDTPVSIEDLFHNVNIKIDKDILTDYQKVQMARLLVKIHRLDWKDELSKMNNIGEILLLIDELKRGK